MIYTSTTDYREYREAADFEAYMAEMEHDLKPIDVACQCGVTGHGSARELEKCGWVLSRELGEVCPQCHVTDSPIGRYSWGRL